MIEITENQTLTITPAIKELIRSLRNRGVLFALDDFGTDTLISAISMS
jgi:EAL domain-containing protein (putative c-di-GMP-specific phosphodiesterase class I)